MFAKKLGASSALPAQFEGTPGVYAKRESPPQIPLSHSDRSPTLFNKDSRSLSGSHVSLIRNRADSSQSITTISQAFPTVLFEQPVDETGNGVNATIRRLSHTPQRAQRRAASRHELSSHSFNVPHTSTNYKPGTNNIVQRRFGKPASLENARNSQDSDVQYAVKGRLGPAISFGNFVEPLNLPPIALQNVYAASRNGHLPTTIQEQIGNFESNITSNNDPAKLNLDRLPKGWEVGLTDDGVRFYIDHNNGRTHWIHPLAPENLSHGWSKIFDTVLGVVFYNHNEGRSQFEHPGFAASTSFVGGGLPTIHGSTSFQSTIDGLNDDCQEEEGKKLEFEDEEEGLNIINNEDVPEWLKLYSQAPSSSDHLLNFNLFRLSHLEVFDGMIMKLYKAEILNTVAKYEQLISKIDDEMELRHHRRYSRPAGLEQTLGQKNFPQF